jgi:polygalacturonase
MFGAAGDGHSMDTRAIQSAIDAANRAGGGVVLLPQGTYLSGSLRLKSNVDFHLDADATLLGSASRSDYQKGRWYALLLAEGQENLSISGPGTIDGQGRKLAQDVIRRVKAGEIADPMAKDRPNEQQRPVLIELRRCRRLRVSGVTLRNSSCWVQNYIECEDLLMDRVRVDSTAYWNNDGMDITDCKRVRVTRCDVNSADDGICLKSNVGGSGCDDVEVADCRVRSSASAFKCGTASHAGFRNIRVRGLTVYDTFRSAVALESVDGGALENVRIENVRATNTGNAIFLRLGHRKTADPVGRLNDIVIRDVKVEIPSGAPDGGYEIAGRPPKEPHNPAPSSIVGIPGHPVRNVLLDDVEIVYAGGGKPQVARVPIEALSKIPELADSYPEFTMFGELPAWGFYLRHAQGIELRNVRMLLKQADFRAALVGDDITGLRLDRLDTGAMSGAPAIVLNRARETVLREVRYPKGMEDSIVLMGGSSPAGQSR